jgi:hypothetical protein
VTIGTIPTATLYANPTSVAGGAASMLTWSSTNATSCTATGGTFAGAKAVNGSQSTGALTTSAPYSLTCTGAGGTSTAASVTVTIAPIPTATLTANPTAISSGGSSTLTWNSTNATSCTASGGWSGTKVASGTQSTGALTTSAAYSLTCTGLGGTSAVTTATVTIGTIPTATLNANPTSVASGGSSTLTWSSTNATSCTATGGTFAGAKAANGSQSTGALTATTPYSLTCTGAGGTSTAAPATVTIAPLPTATLTANPASIASGGTSTLTWSSTNATSCTASGGWTGTKTASGTQSTGALTANTTYSLTCSGAGGTTTASVTVSIAPVPTATLTANPTTLASGATSTLTWSSTNATSCTATGGAFAGAKGPSGSQSTGALTSNTTYTLKCTGTGGTSAAATATIAIVPTAALTANPTAVVSGAPSMLTWSSTNATSCTATGGTFAGTKVPSGSQTTGALTASTSYSLTCTGTGGSSAPANATVTIASGTVSVSPKAASITTSQTQKFTATVPGGATPTWSVDTIAGGNSTVGTIDTTGLYTPGTAAGTHTILATSGTDSGTATLGVTDLAGVYTYHNDLARDGANTKEYGLTPSTVNAGGFGKLTSCAVDGAIYGQPLWVANLTVSGTKHNVVFVATQHDSLYAFDADASPCVQLWWAKLVDTAHTGGTTGETSVPSILVGQANGDIAPEVGVTSTPVIDPTAGILYVLAKSTNSTQTTFYQRLHAIDLATGTEKTGSPALISGTYPGTGDGGTTVSFNALQEGQRPGLALVNGVVYIAWASHGDNPPFYGWVMGYQYASGAWTRKYVFNAAPNVNSAPGQAGKGAGIWMTGSAPAVDTSNNIYVVTGNGPFDANSSSAPNNDYGDSLLQLSTGLTVSQYYTPAEQLGDNTSDFDFGSGGAAVLADLPNTYPHPHLLICGGKSGQLYVLNRDALLGYDPTTSYPHVLQQVYSGGTLYASGAFWNNNFYIAAVGKPLSTYTLTTSPTAAFSTSGTPASSISYAMGGGTPSVSSAATANGIVWALDNANFCTTEAPGCGPTVLHAYVAINLATELWNSGTGSDKAGNAVKFTVPTIANGKVYVGTRGNNAGGADSSTTTPGELDIYALKP